MQGAYHMTRGQGKPWTALMAGQSGCHIWPAMLTQSDFSNPTQIRQIGGGGGGGGGGCVYRYL